MLLDFEPYKNKHIGQRVFILGCAPSLTQERLDLLQGEQVIACNKSFLATTHGLPDYSYFFLGDALVYKELYTRWYPQLSAIKSPRFYSSKIADIMAEDNIAIKEDYIPIKKNYSNKLTVERKGHPLSFDKGWGTTRTTPLDAAITAYFMGFREIYLLGVDLDYVLPDYKLAGNSKTHFYGSGPREHQLIGEVSKKNSRTWGRIQRTIGRLNEFYLTADTKFANLSKGFKHEDVMCTGTLEGVIK